MADETAAIDVIVQHTAESATLLFNTSLDRAVDFWGVNNVEVLAVLPHPSPPSPPSAPGEWAPVAHDIWVHGASTAMPGWTSSVPLSSSAVTTCGIYGTMVGGFGVFGAGDHIEKTFTGLPPHTALRIRATFFKIDQCAATPRCVPPLRWCFCFAAV